MAHDIQSRRKDFNTYARGVWAKAQMERIGMGHEEIPYGSWLERNKDWVARDFEEAKQARLV